MSYTKAMLGVIFHCRYGGHKQLVTIGIQNFPSGFLKSSKKRA